MSLAPRLALTSLLASFLLVVGLAPATASAHSGKQSYLYVSLFEDGIDGRVEIPVADLGPVLGIDFSGDPAGLRAGVFAARAEIEAYIAEHTGLGTATESWNLEFGDISVLPTENGPYVVLDFVVDEDLDEVPRSFVADFAVIVESNPERDSLLLIEDDWPSATFDNGSGHLLGFSVGMTEQVVELENESTLSSMAAIRGMGSDEVREEIDLLLLVAAVTTTLVLVPLRREQSTPRPLSTVGRNVATAAGVFVLAATISLWIVGLGALTLPTRVTAAIVAGTLALQAVYLTAARFRASTRTLATAMFSLAGLAFGFGLGAGFVLNDLDRSRPVTGLVAFQVGALIAALLVALFIGLPLLLLRRTRYVPAIVVTLSVVFVGYAVAWSGELLANDDWPIEKLANPLRVWPRNFWFVLLALAAAGAVRAIEQRAGRLRPTDAAPTAPSPDPVDAPNEMVSR
jgi:hypothetical protein